MHGGRHRYIIRDRIHHQHREAVHVGGGRRESLALRKLLRREAVGLGVSPQPTITFGHTSLGIRIPTDNRIEMQRSNRLDPPSAF
jgi:hypothetical protein